MDLTLPYLILKLKYIENEHNKPIVCEKTDIHTLNFPIFKSFITSSLTGLSKLNSGDILDIWADLSEKIKTNQPCFEQLYVIGVSPVSIDTMNTINPTLAHFYKNDIDESFYKSIYLIRIKSNNAKTILKMYDITQNIICNLDLFKEY